MTAKIRTRSSLLLGSALLGSVVVAACGGAGGEAKAPAKAPEPEVPTREPSSIEEAQEQIARARTDLSAGESGKKATEADKDSAAPPPSPGAGVREEHSRVAPADSCSQSCRALSSMRRAVSALCRMTGEEDARCSEAKKTLGESESRVARCHCSP